MQEVVALGDVGLFPRGFPAGVQGKGSSSIAAGSVGAPKASMTSKASPPTSIETNDSVLTWMPCASNFTSMPLAFQKRVFLRTNSG